MNLGKVGPRRRKGRVSVLPAARSDFGGDRVRLRGILWGLEVLDGGELIAGSTSTSGMVVSIDSSSFAILEMMV